jgi:hypothetical protein
MDKKCTLCNGTKHVKMTCGANEVDGKIVFKINIVECPACKEPERV